MTAEVRDDRKGVFSARAMEQLQPISNVTIREIWARSWATDAIYNAILYGSVLPPERLVLMGVTSRNVARWESLARATGTEVFIYGLNQDLVSSDFPGARAQSADELTQDWNAWVIANASRRRANSSPGTVSVLWNVPAGAKFSRHTRDRYHDYLIHTLSWVVPVSALADSQDRLIRDEEERMLNERTDRLLKESPPPPFREPERVAAQPQRRLVAVQPVVAPVAVQGRAVQTVRGGTDGTPETDGSPANETCHEECSDEVVCGPITYVQVCNSGYCFDVPRQDCSSTRVCRPVCP
jgi:hypothetical protein